MSDIRQFAGRDRVTATRLNEMVSGINANRPMLDESLTVTNSGFSTGHTADQTLARWPLRGRIMHDTGTSVRVSDITWYRRGKAVDLAKDTGKTYKTITGLSTASTTYYIYVSATATSTTYNGLPYTVGVNVSTSAPVDTDENKIVLLGTVATNSDGAIVQINQKHTGGDINQEQGWWPAPWWLYEVTPTSYSFTFGYHYNGSSPSEQVYAWKTSYHSISYVNLTYNVFTGCLDSGTITDDSQQCVFARVNGIDGDGNAPDNWELIIEAADTFDTESDLEGIIPLFYLPWSTDHIDRAHIMDYSGRSAKELNPGVSGSFEDNSGNTVVVVNGVIVSFGV